MNQKATGIRVLFTDDLRDERSVSPRPKLSHPVRFYIDRKNLSRPLFAFHQLARISELFLYRAKFGAEKCRDHLERVESFFIEVRRQERNILATYDVSKPIPRKDTPKLRERATKLFDEAFAIRDLLSSPRNNVCPVCRGYGKLNRSDYEWVKVLLEELVKEGRVKREDIPAPLAF